MLPNISTFGASSSGIGALGFDPKAFVIQLITFILAYFVLKRYAFGPILKVLRERRETIDKGVKLGEQMQKDKAELAAQVETTLQETRVKADEIISASQDSARQIVRAAEDKAKIKAEGVIKSAEERIQQETALARQKLEKEVVGLIADATEAVIGEKVDDKKDIQIIERTLKGIST